MFGVEIEEMNPVNFFFQEQHTDLPVPALDNNFVKYSIFSFHGYLHENSIFELLNT